jgi:LuxR family maltose regulon positive regulatory protein
VPSSASAVPESSVPIVGTKLQAPASVSRYRERPRISALLDRGLEDSARLTLLSAPPGYGKTVAATGWTASRGLDCAWLSLDAADNDLARFVRYLVAALRAVRPDAGAATLSLFGTGASPSIDLVGATLLDEIAVSDDPFVLILDDYHVIGADPIHRLVRFLIERGPPFAHLVLLTREDPPLPLARLRAHGRLVELRADDLRYTEAEASAYLAEAQPADLDPGQVAGLLERTEGWIAGLQLAAISLRDRADTAALIEAFGGSQRFVFDYLADEVLSRVDEDLRSFLVRTAIPERFTLDLCRVLTGREDAGALLDQAERANLFLVRLAEGGWYRYHGLFADYLRSQLGDSERRRLHERAADWFERAGLASEAIENALAAGSADRAIRLVERAARPAFETGELATLLGWLEALRPDRVSLSPELVSLHAWTLFETGQVGAALTRAGRHLASSNVRGPAEGRLLILQAMMATVTGPDAEHVANEGLDLVGFGTELAGPAVWRHLLRRMGYPAPVGRRALRGVAGAAQHRAVGDVERGAASGERDDVVDGQVRGLVGWTPVARPPVAVLTPPGTQHAGAETLPGPRAVQSVVPTPVGLPSVLSAPTAARLVTTPQTVHSFTRRSSMGWVARSIRSGCYIEGCGWERPQSPCPAGG